MRALWCTGMAFLAMAYVPVPVSGFSSSPAMLRLGCNSRATCTGVVALRAIIDKIPLPQSPKPSEIMKSLENKEVYLYLRVFSCMYVHACCAWCSVDALRLNAGDLPSLVLSLCYCFR